MPFDPIRELIHLTAPVFMDEDIDTAEDGTITIKGFASVEIQDRSGDIVPPEEFDIEQFMAAPALLVNHEFWRDAGGNRRSVGRPKSLHVAKLERIKDDKTRFAVKDTKTKQIITTIPRSRVPNLRAGDRGLFVFVSVSEPAVVKMVERGELSAFSWRGLATVAFRVNKESRKTERILTDIDLFEISLVNIPDNPNATFVLGKSAALMIRLDKTRFEDLESVKVYLDKHNLNSSAIGEDDTAFISRQLSEQRFELDKVELTKMAGGVSIITAPLKQEESDKEILEKDDLEKLLNLDFVNNGEIPMAEDTTKEIVDEVADEKKETEKTAPDTTEEDRAEAVKTLANSVATQTVEGLAPLFEAMTTSVNTLTDTIKGLVTVKETDVEKVDTEKEEQKKSNDEVWGVLNDLALGLKKTEEALVVVAKTAATAEKTTAEVKKSVVTETTERAEKIEVEKEVDDSPNDCMTGLFPFLVSE